MRRSKTEKERSRDEIVAAAARLYRENGIGPTSVSEVMGAAGMTHGGFYRHFSSKDDLAAAAIARAFETVLSVFSETPTDPAAETRAYVDRYLSDAHLNCPAEGCPILQLGPEAARGPAVWGEAIEAGMSRALAYLARGLPGGRKAAIELLSILIGTVLIARATGDTALRAEIVENGRASAEAILFGARHPSAAQG